jgi:Yip1 domain.
MALQINPWKTLWTAPTATFATLIAEAPGYNVLTLSILMGFGSALSQFSGSGIGLAQGLALTLLLGPVMGLGELYIGSWLLAHVGRWLGGQGDPVTIRTIMAWAGLPNVAALLCWLLMLLQAGDALFTERSDNVIKTLAGNPLFVIPATVQMVLSFWSISLLVIGLGTAQRLPLGKALLNLLIAILAATLLFLPIKWLWDHGF